MKAQVIVDRMLEAGPDDVAAKDYLRQVPAWREERWCFTAQEWADAHLCNGNDELVATVSTDPDDPEHENEEALTHIIVLRNGQVTNQFAGGLPGLATPELQQLADAEETLYSPKAHEIADMWRDVVAGEDGKFIRWGKL
jgi:hypothetical protein